MEAKELRIGNWVIINTPFCMDYNAMHDTYIDNDWDELKPMPLTEEWLVKFGFENMSETTDYYFKLNDFIIGGWRKTLYPSINGESGLEAFGIEIKYVHQLQNLYFALTGEELIIK